MIATARHIILMNSTRSWGGGEKWHFETALLLMLRGYQTTMVCYPGSELHKRCLKASIPVHVLPIRNWSYLNFLKLYNLTEWLIKTHPSAIIFNSSTDLKFGGIAARLAKIPSVIYRRGSAIPLKNHLMNRLLFKNALTGVIANSLETARTINQNYPFINPEKIKVIYNGLDFSELDDGTFSKLYERKGDELILGNAGRFAPQKNHADLIKMAEKLAEKAIPFKLILAGTGPLEADLRKLTLASQLEDKIVFLDFVEDMASFYRSIDVFVLSSKWEGFGYVLAEALYFEKPVVAYRISSNPEIVQENNSGYLVEPGNPGQLADAVVNLYQNKNKARQMGEFGKQDVLARFSKEKNFQQLIDYLG